MPNRELQNWFLENKRALPWRDSPTPYRVWVSEVMLQQTQASVVVPYFERWMERFPTIESLASAPLDTIIKMWEGLGYYSRARNLHEGAKFLLENYGGELPSTKEELISIKGLGDYTAGAILNFAFHKKAAAVDGNVVRVISRLYKVEEDMAKSSAKKRVASLVEKLLPDKRPWLTSEALIELGALVCTRSPNCGRCPVQRHCLAYREGTEKELPFTSKKIRMERVHRAVAIIESEGHFLVQREKRGKVMSDLYEFPYFDKGPLHDLKACLYRWGISPELVSPLPKVTHTFTRYHVTLTPYHFKAEERKIISDYEWLTTEKLKQLAFSAGHRKIFEGMINAYSTY